ncbi:MAG: ABC transporter permease [Planctomycetota bacterium]
MSEACDTPALRFRGFGLGYPGISTPLLREVDLEIPRGSFVLLTGPSGAGKSSLLRLITGLWDPREQLPRLRGEFSVLGTKIRRRLPRTMRSQVQAVLQDGGLFDELDARGNVELALRAASRPKTLAPALMAQGGLSEPLPEISRFSGGMRKRLAVARALAGEPDLLVFDEPTAGLDPDSARAIAELIHQTHQQQIASGSLRTTIVITHDIGAFSRFKPDHLRIDPASKTLRFGHDEPPESAIEPHVDDEEMALELPASDFVHATSDLASSFVQALLRIVPRHPMRCVHAFVDQTLQAALFVAAGTFVVGVLATYFALGNNPLEGSFENTVIAGLGQILIAVLAPLLVGILFTARVAAGAAARLAAMKRSRQLDAMRLLGLSPVDMLCTPGVLGSLFAVPLVTAIGIVFSAAGSAVAVVAVSSVRLTSWSRWFLQDLDRWDVFGTVGKAVLSAFLVAVLTYHVGTGPKRSSRAVSMAVDNAIVLGILATLTVHAAFTLALYG